MHKRILNYVRKGFFVFALMAALGSVNGINTKATEIGTTQADSSQVNQNQVDPNVAYDNKEIEAGQWVNVSLNQTYLQLGIGAVGQLSLVNVGVDPSTYTVTYESANQGVATVDANGLITAVAEGSVDITCVVRTTLGNEFTYVCPVTVTNPKFGSTQYVIAKNKTLTLDIQGTTSTNATLISSDASVLRVGSNCLVTGVKQGTVTVQAQVDGVTITTTVIVSEPKLNKDLFLFTKGQSSAVKVTGQTGITPVQFLSSKPTVASVTPDGRITALSIGVSVITVTVDNSSYAVTVSVGNRKTIGALKKAQSVLGCRYSQPRRMRKGYYDCSSLVWRSYKPYGEKFGNSKYAPTAAGEAYNMTKRKKVVAYKYVSESKLRPGDVLFISSKRNGRYRNITHVALYIGNNRIIHATGTHVQYGTYAKYKKTIVEIARPAK